MPMDATVPPDSSLEEPDTGLDPDVVFEWTETLPGQGTCGPNIFVGSFSCTLDDNPLQAVAGQASFELTAGPEGLLVLVGQLSDPFGIGALIIELSGSLDCVSYELSASGQAGFALGGIGMPPLSFEAAMSGTYDPETLDILGEVALTFSSGQVCTGAFSVGANP